MPTIRNSVKLTKFKVSQLYQVPAGKSASVSAAIVNPQATTLFVQQAAVNPEFTLSAPIAYTFVQHDHYKTPDSISLGILAAASPLRLKSVANAYVNCGGANTTAIGFTFSYSTAAAPDGEFSSLVPTVPTYTLKSMPTIDYLADTTKTNTMVVRDSSPGFWRVIRKDSLDATYRLSVAATSGISAKFENANHPTVTAASYDNAAIAFSAIGYGTYFSQANQVLTTSDGSVASTDFSSEPSTNSPYWMVSSRGNTLTGGTGQVFFDSDGSPQWWFSSHHASTTPLMSKAPCSGLTSSNAISGWTSMSSQSFTGFAAGEKLLWCRWLGGYYYVGSSAGKIYRNTAWDAAFTAIAAPPADADVQFPPVRISASYMAFRSIAGNGYHLMDTGTAWDSTNAGLSRSAQYPAVADPLLANTLTAAGVTQIHSTIQTGSRSIDCTVFSATSKYTVSVPFDYRDPAADFNQKMSNSFERTNIVLVAGDRVFVYTEGDNTIAHVYGYEE